MNTDRLNEEERQFLGCLLTLCIFATGFTLGVIGAMGLWLQ